MFNLKKPHTKSGLELAIDDLHDRMSEAAPCSEEYDKLTTQLGKLMKLRENDISRNHIKPDTLVLAATNLLGIAMIVHHEREHVITTKALGFVKAVFK